MELVCPLCGEVLQRQEKQYVCPNRHSFDIARQGYVHLLPVQNKHSRNPGDTREQVLSRRTFLEAGFYSPIADALAQEAAFAEQVEAVRVRAPHQIQHAFGAAGAIESYGHAAGIAGLDRTAVFSVGSDGTDGPTDAAGGFVTDRTAAQLAEQGIAIFDVLQNNDAYNALKACDGLIMTGATGTNVNDVAVLLIDR